MSAQRSRAQVATSRSSTAGAAVVALDRERQATALRIQGLTFRQIGDALGIDEATAYRAVRRSLVKTRKATDESAEELRRLEAARLDTLQDAIWADAVAGHLGAVDRVLRIMVRRAELFGLDAPTKVEASSDGRLEVVVTVNRNDRPPILAAAYRPELAS